MATLREKRSTEELKVIHEYMKEVLTRLFGLKFEICLATARHIIRTDYHTVDLDTFNENTPTEISNDIITIQVDPYSTTKKVYYQVIDNIYAAKELDNAIIKDIGRLTKEQRLLLLIEINFLHHYLGKSQIKIGNYIFDNKIANIDFGIAEDFSKEVNRYIKLANKIRNTSDNITPDQFLVY